MSKAWRRSCGDEAGFTLIEALAATVLMGMILGALAILSAQWLPNWNRGFGRVQRIELLDVALDRIVKDLADAVFITAGRGTTDPLFEGSELAVTFVRSAWGPNVRPGLEIVRIAETADRLGPALVRARTSFVPNVGADRVHFSDPVVLLRMPYRFTFGYAGQDQVWKSTWLQQRELPSIVRLTVRDAPTEQTLSVSTTALIHTQLPAVCATSKNDRRCGSQAHQQPAEEASVREQ
jgi:general secretion pathway protein J